MMLCVLAAGLAITAAAQATSLSASDFSYITAAPTDEWHAGGLNAAWNTSNGEFTFDGSFGFTNTTSNYSHFDVFHQPTQKDWSAVTGLKFDVTVETTNVATASDIWNGLVTIYSPNTALNASNTIDATWTYDKLNTLNPNDDSGNANVDDDVLSYFPGLRFYARLDNGGDGIDLFNDDVSWGAHLLDVTKSGGPTTFGDYPVTTYTFEMLFDNVDDPKLLPDTFDWVQQNGNVVTDPSLIARRYHASDSYPLMPEAEPYGSTYLRDNVESLRISTFFKSGKWIGSDEQITVTLDNIELTGGSVAYSIPAPPAALAGLPLLGALGMRRRR